MNAKDTVDLQSLFPDKTEEIPGRGQIIRHVAFKGDVPARQMDENRRFSVRVVPDGPYIDPFFSLTEGKPLSHDLDLMLPG